MTWPPYSSVSASNDASVGIAKPRSGAISVMISRQCGQNSAFACSSAAAAIPLPFDVQPTVACSLLTCYHRLQMMERASRHKEDSND